MICLVRIFKPAVLVQVSTLELVALYECPSIGEHFSFGLSLHKDGKGVVSLSPEVGTVVPFLGTFLTF